MSIVDFNRSYSVFTHMNKIAKRTIAKELGSNLESNIQSLAPNTTSRLIETALLQLVLDRIQRNILNDSEIKNTLLEKGMQPEKSARNYETEVVNALVSKSSEIQALFSRSQKSSEWTIGTLVSWVWSSFSFK